MVLAIFDMDGVCTMELVLPLLLDLVYTMLALVGSLDLSIAQLVAPSAYVDFVRTTLPARCTFPEALDVFRSVYICRNYWTAWILQECDNISTNHPYQLLD